MPLIDRVAGKTKDAGARDQFEEINPHSYAAVLADLRTAVIDLLGTSNAGEVCAGHRGLTKNAMRKD